MSLNESIVEDAALTWFGELGYEVGQEPHFAFEERVAHVIVDKRGRNDDGELKLAFRRTCDGAFYQLVGIAASTAQLGFRCGKAQAAGQKRMSGWMGAETFSVAPKNKRPRQSPEPIADRESPVSKRNFAGCGFVKQSLLVQTEAPNP